MNLHTQAVSKEPTQRKEDQKFGLAILLELCKDVYTAVYNSDLLSVGNFASPSLSFIHEKNC